MRSAPRSVDGGALRPKQRPTPHIGLGIALQPRDLLGPQRPDQPGGRAQDHRTIGKLLALGHDGAGADQAVPADHSAVEHPGLDTDQRAVADDTAVQHGLVSCSDAFADGQRLPWIGVQNGPILPIGIASDTDGFIVAAQYGTKPDTAVLREFYIADNRCRWRDVGTGGNAWN